MASSLIGGLVNSGMAGDQIAVVDINSDACEKLEQRFGVRSSDNTANLAEGASVVIAVKPHIVETVCRSISTSNPALVISVAAGVRGDSMSQWLPPNTAIVRCMPNTPALLGLGATALHANENCSQDQRLAAQDLLNTAGKTQWVNQESQLDAITALSGSGPAYFFYMIEHMAKAAENLGLDPDLSRDFAIETAFGAASMARAQEHSPQVLRENVTSKGGTTAAALSVFNEQNLPDIIAQAMQAAADRAIELGDEFGAAS
ncbi:UNVERIFIED_CONTAM: hypothetical protein GTU68_051241 [Idotea baltica]|nr:hypothetical protein [Idotea baltica]